METTGADLTPILREAMESVVAWDEMDPNAGSGFRSEAEDSGARVRLTGFRGMRPVVLIFGRPPFRAQIEHMERLYDKFKDRIEFFVIYVEEIHPTDGWQVVSNIDDRILYRQSKIFDER